MRWHASNCVAGERVFFPQPIGFAERHFCRNLWPEFMPVMDRSRQNWAQSMLDSPKGLTVRGRCSHLLQAFDASFGCVARVSTLWDSRRQRWRAQVHLRAAVARRTHPQDIWFTSNLSACVSHGMRHNRLCSEWGNTQSVVVCAGICYSGERPDSSPVSTGDGDEKAPGRAEYG